MDQNKKQNIPEVPSGVVDVIIDTDAYNEVDDQFAISMALRLPERIRVVGICAAPFLNARSSSPAEGMEKSFAEILKLLKLAKKEDLTAVTFRGSEQYLPDEKNSVMSDAATFMAKQAENYSPEHPLYIVALGAITNVASAILLNPKAMTENTVLVWLGGHAKDYVDTKEFNMRQDIAAARVCMGCGVPLVLLPCNGVVSEFRTTKPELEYWLKGKNPLADYLASQAIAEAESYAAGKPWSRCIWDVTAVAWLVNDGEKLMKSYVTPSPLPEYDGTYALDENRYPIRYVYKINRDALFEKLFDCLTK